MTAIPIQPRKAAWTASPRASMLAEGMLRAVRRRADRMFAGLLVGEWVAGIAASLWLSPRLWSGPLTQTDAHLWAALVVGGGIVALPVWLAYSRPAHAATRQAVAVGQVGISALLIFLTNGKLQTHLLLFASLAMLACYRDGRVLATASLAALIVTAASAAALASADWLSYAAWIVCFDLFLAWSCRLSRCDIEQAAERMAFLEVSDARPRTTELNPDSGRLPQDWLCEY